VKVPRGPEAVTRQDTTKSVSGAVPFGAVTGSCTVETVTTGVPTVSPLDGVTVIVGVPPREAPWRISSTPLKSSVKTGDS
jgi:hypothetical protein